MIVQPPRPASAARATAAPRATGTGGGDADNAGALALLDARITALTARTPTPDDEALEQQREQFDFITRVQAELERETNALRELAMEQMKQDDEMLKKWIELI